MYSIKPYVRDLFEVFSQNGKSLYLGSMEQCTEYCDCNEVIDYIDRLPITKKILKITFDRWCNSNNWKNPINKTLNQSSSYFDKQLIKKAIMFYTGSEATVTVNNDGSVRVQADGYYKVCGA